MTLLDTFIRSKREIAQLCERVRPVNPADYYYDFIVVGGQYKLPPIQQLKLNTRRFFAYQPSA